MAPGQLQGVAGVVVGPPRLGRVVRALVADGRVPALVGLLPGHRPGRLTVHQHLEPRLAHRTEEVEVLDAEEELGVGQHAGVDGPAGHQRGPPAGHVDRGESGRRRHHVEGVGAPPHEAPAVGHDGTDRRMRGGQAVDPGHEVGHPRRGQVEQADVVLAEVDPPARRVADGRLESGPEAAGRTGVDGQPDHPHRGLEVRVVESALAVDHDHHATGVEPFVLEQRADDVAGQARPAVGQDHGGDRVRRPVRRPVDRRADRRAGAHRAVTGLG